MSAAIASPGKPPSAGRPGRSFTHNTKAWSGDHCVDPSVVPGVLFCNRPVETENPRLLDIGPTVLDLFGVAVPDYMDGKAAGRRRRDSEGSERELRHGGRDGGTVEDENSTAGPS